MVKQGPAKILKSFSKTLIIIHCCLSTNLTRKQCQHQGLKVSILGNFHHNHTKRIQIFYRYQKIK